MAFIRKADNGKDGRTIGCIQNEKRQGVIALAFFCVFSIGVYV